MNRRAVVIVGAAVIVAARLFAAQEPAADGTRRTFDVVSVKRNPPGVRPAPVTAGIPAGLVGLRAGGRFGAPWVTVRDLVRAAYGVLDIQVVGGPEWAASDRFNLEATTTTDVSAEDARAMLRSLLQDRFKLAARTETRSLPVAALEMARDDRRLGHQLRLSGPDCSPPTPPSFLSGAPPPPPPPPPPAGGGLALMLSQARLRCPGMALIGHISLRAITMPEFATRLVPVVGRLVVDRTGLTGGFDLDLTYAPDPGAEPLRVNGGVVTIDAPALPAALRDQLGLKLEMTKAPAQVVVIDSVEPPAED
jgi:uncharacterized protein (TIGR03435 family)